MSKHHNIKIKQKIDETVKDENCCFSIEEDIAWLIGCIDGFFMGCFFNCYNEELYEPGLVDDVIRGVDYGFKGGVYMTKGLNKTTSL